MTSARCLLTAIWVAQLSCLIAVSGHAAAPSNDACLGSVTESAADACQIFASAIANDPFRLIANGLALEKLGRPESALHLYRAAAGAAPANKRALQGLIRVRAAARARQILIDLEPRPDEISACWSERWMAALRACQNEVLNAPTDARLQERLGDVARGVGDISMATTAYAESLRLAPDNTNLYRKRDALSRLISGEDIAKTAVAAVPKPAVKDARPSPATMAVRQAAGNASPVNTDNEATVRQLELLETLRGKNLIADNEYKDRRDTLLARAFVSNAITAPASKSFRGLATGRSVAVVIGNNRYQAYPELLSAAADAQAVSQVLQDRYGFEVTTLLNADRYQIMSALSALRRSTNESDKILVYYAGHGLLDEDADRGYWLPIDAEPDNMAQWISTSDIAGVFSGAAARHGLVIADSCFAGTLLRDASATHMQTLERLAAKRSRNVLTSGGLEPVIDDGNGEHSVFAAALLDVLMSNNTVLESGRLFALVRDQVVLNADQTPQYAPMQKAGHEGGDFLFIPKTVSAAAGTN